MRRSINRKNLSPIVALTVVVVVVAGEPPESSPRRALGLANADRVIFARRFTRSIWPMMAEPEVTEKGCLACHRDDQSNTSPLAFAGSPNDIFASLLDDGYFDRNHPSALLTRVAHKDERLRMPPLPARPWSPAEVQRLRTFVEELNARRIRASASSARPSRTKGLDGS